MLLIKKPLTQWFSKCQGSWNRGEGLTILLKNIFLSLIAFISLYILSGRQVTFMPNVL